MTDYKHHSRKSRYFTGITTSERHTTEWKHCQIAVVFCRNYGENCIYFTKNEYKQSFCFFLSSEMFPSGVAAANQLPLSESSSITPADFMLQLWHNTTGAQWLYFTSPLPPLTFTKRSKSVHSSSQDHSAQLLLLSQNTHAHTSFLFIYFFPPTAGEVVCGGGMLIIQHPPQMHFHSFGNNSVTDPSNCIARMTSDCNRVLPKALWNNS